ncbi:MAG TPA: hypothetical protein VFK47_14525, partial [Ktedonobacteraceae bacterium]|nr:hypothetical protein [Ktedonobacteraceae bacterium]
TLPTCVRCEATATRHYYTTAFKMGGISYPSDLRMLCQDCYDLVWSVMLESFANRVAVNMAYEQEQEARGVA